MTDHPTAEHGFILNELAHLAETVDAKCSEGRNAMLLALNERVGVELGLAIKAKELNESELIPFLENHLMIAAIFAGQVVDDTYGLQDSETTVN